MSAKPHSEFLENNLGSKKKPHCIRNSVVLNCDISREQCILQLQVKSPPLSKTCCIFCWKASTYYHMVECPHLKWRPCSCTELSGEHGADEQMLGLCYCLVYTPVPGHTRALYRKISHKNTREVIDVAICLLKNIILRNPPWTQCDRINSTLKGLTVLNDWVT